MAVEISVGRVLAFSHCYSNPVNRPVKHPRDDAS